MVPTHGAIVRANFNAQVGMKILMTLTHRGKPVPFGALATGDSNQSGSIVADNGQVYLSGMALAGKVRVNGAMARTLSAWPITVCAGEPAAGAQSAFGRVPLRRS